MSPLRKLRIWLKVPERTWTHEWKCTCGHWSPDLDEVRWCSSCGTKRPDIGVYRRVEHHV